MNIRKLLAICTTVLLIYLASCGAGSQTDSTPPTAGGGDSQTVQSPANQAPVVNAGPYQTITLPNSATLSGTATDDGLPNPPAKLTIAWSQFSGPGTVAFDNAGSLSTTACFSAAGTYTLRLTASDSALSANHDIVVTVQSPANQAPVVNAGPYQTITLPNSATLSGTATDDGLPNPPAALSIAWSKISGPGTVTFGNAGSLSTTASFSAAGTYTLRLTASDSALSANHDIVVTVSAPPTAAGFRKSPYLSYNGNNTQMTVCWQTTVTGTSRISWGLDTSYSSGVESLNELGSDHLFRHLLTGLTPGQKYYYRVELSDRTATGSFVAAPTENGAAALFLYGDTRMDPSEHDRVAAVMVSSYSANPSLQGIVLHSGDLVTDGEVIQDWDTELFNPLYLNISRFLSEVPLQAVIGNHEGNGVLYTTFFPYPFLNGRYWSFDYGVVHVTVVDQYSIPGGGISSEQLAWIASDLAATTKPWKIILLHEPGWSAGARPNNASVQLNIQPLAKRYDAIVVAGHNHYYARAIVDGVNHITTGGGGAPLYTPIMPSPQVLIAEMTHHFCLIETSADTLLFKAVRADGSYIETFTLTR